MKVLIRIIAIACCLHVSALRADPENFIVGGLTFVRPPAWNWVDKPGAAAVAQLKIVDASAPGQTADVYFTFYKPADVNGKLTYMAKRWKNLFEDGNDKSAGGTRADKINDREVMVVQLKGVYH